MTETDTLTHTPISITDEELNSLTQAILRRYGIDFTCYEPISLKRRVIRAINVLKLESVHNLWVKLLRDRDFIVPFIDEVAVGLTSMFRDPVLWRTLKEKIIRTIPNKKALNIWHAGCSTGEEVYSMAIVLQEMGLLSSAQAWATDMSEASLKTAQQGVYHSLKIQEYGKNFEQYNNIGLFKRYYRPEGDHGKMNASLVQHVNFKAHNLITDPVEGNYDIIFCRNVMIYFDQASKIKLLDKFYNHLNTGGLLIIGFYDALVPLIDKSKFHFLDLNAKVFQKI